MEQNTIEKAAALLAQAQVVLIGAGAGLSAAAGLDYTDEDAFAQRFPGMLQYGATNQYQLMGYPFSDEALKWGYLAVSLDHVYQAGTTSVYQDLWQLVKDKNYFIITSNVDRYFHKNGFDSERIYTPQGDYELFQCFSGRHDLVWDGKPIVKALLPSINRETQRVEDANLLPVCPICSGPAFMNVRGGDWFIETPYQDQVIKLNHWLDGIVDEQLVLLEVGAGFNTPGVIRLPMEAIFNQFPKANLIRINRDNASGPDGILSIASAADQALNLIKRSI